MSAGSVHVSSVPDLNDDEYDGEAVAFSVLALIERAYRLYPSDELAKCMSLRE